jgi:hypothetical protein
LSVEVANEGGWTHVATIRDPGVNGKERCLIQRLM